MAKSKRANGAGGVYIKHGSFYGRWLTLDGGHANRRLGTVRRPGTRDGLTRTQAEKRLRELMEVVQVVSDPDRTVEVVGLALVAQLEAKGSAKSHVETAESHLRIHLVPSFKDKPMDRITDAHVTRFAVHLRRLSRKPETTRNIFCGAARWAGAMMV